MIGPRKMGRPLGGPDVSLTPLDLVPCSRCGLRGHLPADPEKCLVRTSTGLGCQPWIGVSQ